MINGFGISINNDAWTTFNTKYIRFGCSVSTYTMSVSAGFRYFLITGLLNNIGIYAEAYTPGLYFISNSYDSETTKLYNITSSNNIKSVSYSNGTLSITYNAPYSVGILFKL